MIFHENRLSADDYHEMSCLIFIFEKLQNLKFSSALLQIKGGALLVKFFITSAQNCNASLKLSTCTTLVKY